MKSINELLKEKNYYKILNVAENATDGEIKLAYRGLIYEYHPDKIKQTHPEIDVETANRISQIINSAYEVLKNPDKRKEFDEELAALRRQKEQARAAEEYRRQREEARARQQEQERENTYNRAQNAWQGTYGYETNYTRNSYTGDANQRANANSHRQTSQGTRQKAAYGASRKYKRAKKNPYVKATFTKFKSKLADIFSEENINDCKLIARNIAKRIKRIYQKETRGIMLGTINGILIATILFNVFTVNDNKKDMEEPIIPETTITTEIENVVTTPNITYEEPIIIEDKTYEIMEYVTAKYGDSLWSFEQQYGVPIEDIKRDNNLTSDDIIAGVDYKIIKEVSEEDLEDYSVNYAYAGETVSDLARKFNTNEETILNLNKDVIDENGNIKFGTSIVNVPDLDRSHSYHR
ncbi:MAG: DnaJ domain-containing protein [Bacilli bacterium]|nr:DnaJ domain-containing protein [Bacilli bacterium]